MTNQASHHIDLLEYMMGEVESVYAMATTAAASIETEDTAVVTLNFKSGALGVIEATTATKPVDIEGSLSILGSKGTVEIGGFAVNKLKTWNVEGYEDINFENFSENPPDVYGFGHKTFYENVISSLQGNKTEIVDGLEGLRSLRLIHAIYKSIQNKKLVFLDDAPVFKALGNG